VVIKILFMARPVLRVKGYEPEQIKGLFRKDERYTIGIRLYAIYQVALGQPSRKLEELYNTSFKQITNWVHQFEKEGIEGLKDKAGRGRKSKLDAEQLSRIKDLLLTESPTDHGYNTSTWTGPLLIDWIARQYGLEYKKAQIYNIIKSLGFSYQKGKGIFPEADKQKQEIFKDGLKKTARRKG
jgi:transposase